MLAVDQLLIFVLENTGNVAARMRSLGYSDEQIMAAWDQARA
ncbi:MAG TPA: hypothetical protein VJQ57_12150 [Acidimicrobiia bacterium]|nr:hypothetical protein [Acidimicrobiia bacterium]